ncbi:MAG: hypothetical protein LKM37_01715 [Bacteroidales bacterium]|nr:hypothetical protein [Bacteroidales bacterium]MCI1733069.1 hypothetical protein [Bacteroidales bacterium]
MSNKLFASPFGSSAKNEEIKAFQLSTYILQNPLKANLCKKAEEYAWSSASMHFPNNMAISCMNASKYIKIDTSLYDSKFHSYKEFLNHINFIPDSSVRTEQKSVNNNVTLKKIGGDNSSQATGKTGMERRKVWKSEMGKSETEKFEVEKSEMEKFEVEKSEMEKSEMEKSEMGKSEMGKSEMEKSEMEKSEMEKIALECKEINSAQILGNAIFEYLIKNLGGKKLGDLTEEEEKGLIKTVFKKTDCKIVELANAVHESYNFVYRLLKKVKKFRRNFFT